ncbi:MAG: hypothetical protein SGJ17_01160 [Hyphomicrobiales bacterium]|nr:hypothetical protein [Hyphomicrobiales bacterium]
MTVVQPLPANPQKRALIFGHSHVWAIRRALVAGTYEKQNPYFQAEILLCGTQEFPGSVVVYDADHKEHINPALVGALNSAFAGRNPIDACLVSCVGNIYNAIGLLQDTRPFDFVVPGREDLPLDKKAALIPYDAVAALLADRMRDIQAMIKRLRRIACAAIIHIGAPPPIESGEFIAAKLSAAAAPRNALPLITEPHVRLKLWLAQTDIMATWSQNAGATFMHPPVEAFDAVGFLKQDYWCDSIHANRHYGALVLKKVEALTMEHFANQGANA